MNQSQRSSVAESLEIDGHPDIAATAGVTGNISEFMHRNGTPTPQRQAAKFSATAHAGLSLGIDVTTGITSPAAPPTGRSPNPI